MRKNDQPGPPCSHMKTMLHDAAEGRARGLKLWFTLQHVLHCGPCRRYLECLKEMIAALRGKAKEEMPDEVADRLLSKLAEASDGVATEGSG